MLPSFITALLFAMSAICGRMATDRFGPMQANAVRLVIALMALGGLTLWLNADGFGPHTSLWLVISGMVGFGLGDVALYMALPRLGSRLTLLMNFCAAPIFAAAADFLLRGDTVRPLEAVAGLIVLTGVVLALMPEAMHRDSGGRLINPLFKAGVLWGLLAGFGQGVGASLSKLAHTFAEADGARLTGIGEAFQRVCGGLVIALPAWLLVHWWHHRNGSASASRPPRIARPHRISLKTPGRAWFWLLGAALFGPVIGVSCFQWALHMAPSAIVLTVIATSPLLVIPLARWLEKDTPRPVALLGSFIAVAGLALLLTSRAA